VDKSRYPIGYFTPSLNPSVEGQRDCIQQVSGLSKLLRAVVCNLDQNQLQTPYRSGGWTIQQIVHHLADNDMNAYLRLKRALTEKEPVASSYREDLWAELNDYKAVPIETSISLLEALHDRLVVLLHSLNPDDYNRTLKTEALGVITIDIALQRFVWHHRHHMAQIKFLRDNKGW
jgi:hypothetical protein